jgi:hypothetical protein
MGEDREERISSRDIQIAEPETVVSLRVRGANNLLMGGGLILLGVLLPVFHAVRDVNLPMALFGILSLGFISAGVERLVRGFHQRRLAGLLALNSDNGKSTNQ